MSQVDTYGLALMMIREGAGDPQKIAASALAKFKADDAGVTFRFKVHRQAKGTAMTDPDIIETVAQIIRNHAHTPSTIVATNVLSAVTPLIRTAALEEAEEIVLAKRPVAWRVRDFADGWIVFQDKDAANREVEQTGTIMQGLYVRDGT